MIWDNLNFGIFSKILNYNMEYSKILNNAVRYSDLPIRNIVNLPFKIKTVASYGVILYSTKGYWFLVRRRYSPEYLELIRGSYVHSDIKLLLEGCSPEEIDVFKKIIASNNFIELFTIEHRKVVPESDMHLRNAIDKLRDCFYILKEQLSKVKPDYDQSEWLPPKGKQTTYNEKPFDAALREFVEETGLDASKINLVSDIPIEESYIGRNNKIYQTICWLYITEELQPVDVSERIYKVEYKESEEIAYRGWFTYDECINVLRDSKREALMKAYNIIMNKSH